MFRFLFCLLALAVALIFIGCSSNSSSSPTPVTLATTADHAVTISGMPSAVPTGVTITVLALSRDGAAALAPISPLLSYVAGVDIRPNGMTLLAPVTVAIKLTAAQTPGAIIPLYTPIGGVWQSSAVQGTVSADGLSVSAQLSQLTQYALFQPLAAPAPPYAISAFATSAYTAGIGFVVQISAVPASTTLAYAVEDTPPAGWTVTGITNNGVYDAVNGKVKWGPFLDTASRTLAYTVTPSATASGTATFTGTASFDGVNLAITGNRTLASRAR